MQVKAKERVKIEVEQRGGKTFITVVDKNKDTVERSFNIINDYIQKNPTALNLKERSSLKDYLLLFTERKIREFKERFSQMFLKSNNKKVDNSENSKKKSSQPIENKRSLDELVKENSFENKKEKLKKQVEKLLMLHNFQISEISVSIDCDKSQNRSLIIKLTGKKDTTLKGLERISEFTHNYIDFNFLRTGEIVTSYSLDQCLNLSLMKI